MGTNPGNLRNQIIRDKSSFFRAADVYLQNIHPFVNKRINNITSIVDTIIIVVVVIIIPCLNGGGV